VIVWKGCGLRHIGYVEYVICRCCYVFLSLCIKVHWLVKVTRSFAHVSPRAKCGP